jgi:hypothetical protein
MGWVHIFRFVMIHGILMPTVIRVLLNLLGMVTIHRVLIQICNDILQVFISSGFGFAHVLPLL